MANTVGDLFFKLGDASRADSLFHVALEILEPLGDHPDLAVTLNGLGEVARRERRLDEAVELFRRALTIRRATLPPDDPRIAQSVGSLATALYNQGGISSQAVAESLYMEVLALGAGVPPETVGAVLEGLGDLSLVQARHASQALREDSARIYYARARERYTESIDRRHTTVSTPTPDVARAMWGLAEAQEELGETEQALQVHRQSLGILRKVYGDQHPDVGLAEYRLGSALVRNATYDEAISVLSNAIRHLESAFGADFPSLLYARDALGRALAEKGRYHEAVVHLEIAVTQYARIAQTTSALTLARDFQTTELFLARAYNEVGRSEEAIRVLRRSFQRWSVEHDRIELAIPIAVELADLFARLGQPDSAAVYRSRADLSRRAGT
jgi:tetratricopeptide (TPR) repeat protein